MLEIVRRALQFRLGSAVHSDHRQIATGAAWVALFVLVGKVAAGAKEITIAWRYGTGGIVDAYQLALTLVTWLPATFLSVISIVLIPLLVRLGREDPASRRELLSELLGVLLVAGSILTLATFALGPLCVTFVGDSLTEATRAMAKELTAGMAPLALFTLMVAILAACLQAERRHVNTLLEAVPPLVILVAILAWPSATSIEPLLWSTVIGVFLQTIWLGRFVWRGRLGLVWPKLSWQSPHWPALCKAAIVMGIGQFVLSFVVPLDQYTAAHLGDAAIATLGYANRVLGLALAIGAIAISRSALPILSELTSAEPSRAVHIASRWAKLLLAMGVVAAMVGWICAPWLITLLFQRGAFTSNDTLAVTAAFQWGLVQMPFFLAGLLLVQLLASQGRYRTIALIAAGTFVVKLCANFPLALWLGVAGIMLATGVMYAFAFVGFLLAIKLQRS